MMKDHMLNAHSMECIHHAQIATNKFVEKLTQSSAATKSIHSPIETNKADIQQQQYRKKKATAGDSDRSINLR